MAALGIPARGKDFFDRETERAELWRYLESNHVLISAPRRLGKTSLIVKMIEEAEAKGYPNDLCAKEIVDLEACNTVEEALSAIDRAFPDKWTGKQLTKVWKGLKTIAQQVKSAKAGPIALELQNLPFPWHNTALVLQERLSPLPVLICMDEFSVFLDKVLRRNRDEGEKFLRVLRAWRLQKTACRFIFSGSIGIQSLLIRNWLTDSFNDCYDFSLGPFDCKNALAMLQQEAEREKLPVSNNVLEHLCDKIGWLSPFFLNLLFDETRRVAVERITEERAADRSILTGDVDEAYRRKVSRNSQFIHWYQRLARDLEEPDLGMAYAILRAVARAAGGAGLDRKQILSRLGKLEADPEARRERMNRLLVFLHEDGYLSQEEPIRFLSFLLRDYWKQNHAS
jgi:hypothetical protein